jgi:hypothetical protein
MPNYRAPYTTIEMEIRVTGFTRVKAVISKLSDAGYYRGAFRDYMKELLGGAKNFAVNITHRLTGDLASSHEWEYDSHRMTGRLYIGRRYVHARGGNVYFPFIYGVYEEERGGTHAFYEQTYRYYVLTRAPLGLRTIVREIEVM